MYGDGSAQRDYTYVDDTVDGITRALDQVWGGDGSGFEILNLGASRTVALRELIELLAEALDAVPNIRQLPVQLGDVPRTFADLTRARELLGYDPKIGIEEGLRRFVAWFLAGQDPTRQARSSEAKVPSPVTGP